MSKKDPRMKLAPEKQSELAHHLQLADGQSMPAFVLELRCREKQTEEQKKAILHVAFDMGICHFKCKFHDHSLASVGRFVDEVVEEQQQSGQNQQNPISGGRSNRPFVSLCVDVGSLGEFPLAFSSAENANGNGNGIEAAAGAHQPDYWPKVDLFLLGLEPSSAMGRRAVTTTERRSKNSNQEESNGTKMAPEVVALDMEPNGEQKAEDGQRTKAKKPFEHLLEAWPLAEGKIRRMQQQQQQKEEEEGTDAAGLPALGLFGALRPEEVQKLWEAAELKPSCWQLDLQKLLDNFEPTLELANRLQLRLLIRIGNGSSKFGEDSARNAFCNNLLREVARRYKAKTATQVLHRWLIQLGMGVVCCPLLLNAANANGRLAAQFDFHDFKISPEDMRRLAALHTRQCNGQLPSPYKLVQKSGSQTGRQLMGRRRLLGDMALGLAVAGICLMVLANEFAFARLHRPWVEAARLGILGCTVALLVATLRYHWLDLRVYMHNNNLHSWRMALTNREKMKIGVELLICAICPLPGLGWPGGDAFLGSLMFLRLYWLPRCLHLHSRLSTDSAAKSIAGLNRVRTDTRFMLKRMLFLYPGLAMSTFVLNFWLIGAYILRLCESNINADKTQTYYNTLWMMSVTFLTIGYGDIYPVTTCGRLMAVLTGVVGVCVASMIVAVIVQKISLSQAEERVHNFMARTKHARNLKETAAQVLKESWFLYKNRQSDDRDRVRLHQRRLCTAICTLRKLRKEQRILQELDGTSLDDVAKISQGAVELVRTMGLAQQGLTERLNTMEGRLQEIQAGIGLLTAVLLPPAIEKNNKNDKNDNNKRARDKDKAKSPTTTATTTTVQDQQMSSPIPSSMPRITVKESSDEGEQQ